MMMIMMMTTTFPNPIDLAIVVIMNVIIIVIINLTMIVLDTIQSLVLRMKQIINHSLVHVKCPSIIPEEVHHVIVVVKVRTAFMVIPNIFDHWNGIMVLHRLLLLKVPIVVEVSATNEAMMVAVHRVRSIQILVQDIHHQRDDRVDRDLFQLNENGNMRILHHNCAPPANQRNHVIPLVTHHHHHHRKRTHQFVPFRR